MLSFPIFCSYYTFFLICLSSMSVGCTTRTGMNTEKTMASENLEERYAFERFSSTLSRGPPTNAPGVRPIPPRTTVTKALILGMVPVAGVRVGCAGQSSTLAIAAGAEPIAEARATVALTLIPISVAVPLSSAAANTTYLARILLMKLVSTTMMIKQTTIVTTVSPEIAS